MSIGLLFAQEQVLFDASAKSDLEGYDYISNFEITSESGYFSKGDLKILDPTERGIRFLAVGVPENVSTSYTVLTPYPSFLNESGSGTGFIYNAASIKSISITATTNRPYDEIILMYSTSPNGEIHEILMPQNFNEVKSMEEFTLTWNNPAYEPDVKKRELSRHPVLGADADGIYLKGFKIKTNAPTGMNAYSEYSILFIKKVTVVCDQAFTSTQLEELQSLKENFGIDENAAAREKAIKLIKERNEVRDTEKSLQATEQ